MKEQKPDVQEEFIGALLASRQEVSIFLVNGIRLNGRLEAADRYVVLLKDRDMVQIVYKHAISTVVPQMPARTESVGSSPVVVRRKISLATVQR